MIRVRLAAAVVLVPALLVGLVACDPSPPTDPSATCRGTGVRTTRDVAYDRVAGVDSKLLSLDLYEPVRPGGCGPAPIVVYVHGGGFSIGDKANKISDKVSLFTGEGWVFASVNYR